jgi:hypothetical protein
VNSFAFAFAFTAAVAVSARFCFVRVTHHKYNMDKICFDEEACKENWEIKSFFRL